jgi:hypothetical protein
VASDSDIMVFVVRSACDRFVCRVAEKLNTLRLRGCGPLIVFVAGVLFAVVRVMAGGEMGKAGGEI